MALSLILFVGLFQNTYTVMTPPANGATWQIQITHPPVNTAYDVAVYDIDMFQAAKNTSLISTLHSQGKDVICYFSVGTREPWRDENAKSEVAKPGRHSMTKGVSSTRLWFDTTEKIVRAGMATRIQRASAIGCDAIDPDNVDTYDNDTGFNSNPVNKTKDQDTAVDYLNFLYTQTQKHGIAMGLKNAGDIIDRVLDKVAFQVNENCANFTECGTFQKFIDAKKPVFHIEYPNYVMNGTALTEGERDRLCSDAAEKGTDPTSKGADGFSTLLKTFDLDEWFDNCQGNAVQPPPA